MGALIRENTVTAISHIHWHGDFMNPVEAHGVLLFDPPPIGSCFYSTVTISTWNFYLLFIVVFSGYHISVKIDIIAVQKSVEPKTT